MPYKAIVAFIGILSAPAALSPAEAPDQPAREQAQERLQQLRERLQLTPEQVEQLRPVFQEQIRKLQAVRDKYSGQQSRRSRMRMARELRDVREATDERLRKILSKEQMDELKKIREEARQQFREKRGRR